MQLLKNELFKNIFIKILVYSGMMIPLFYCFYLSSRYGLNDEVLLSYFLFFIFLISINSLVNKKWLKVLLIFLTTLLFDLLIIIDMGHFLIFNDAVNESSIYIVLETNIKESNEFLSMYFSNKILLLIASTLFFLIISTLTSIFKHSKLQEGKKRVRLYISLAILSVAFLFMNGENFLPIKVYSCISKFKNERKVIDKLNVSPIGHFQNVQHKKSNERETYVVIIGESTTRDHMSLYGYYRNTNPLLSKRKDELVLYKNVRSPHTHTISSLKKTLALGDYENPKGMFNSTLIQLMNAANFESYFISNQKPIGMYESTVTLISKTSDNSIFTNVTSAQDDYAVLDPLDKILTSDKRKKFIIIHLMGTHTAYYNRYPKSFNIFNDEPRTPFKHKRAFKKINEYDNAVLYNDYIVDQIISKVQNVGEKSYVLYFSDHGEDVFQTINEACHTETKATAPMYNIPFILWMSDDLKRAKKNLDIETNRAYNTEHLIHTISQLSSVSFKKFDASKSIINSNFMLNEE